MNKRDIIQHSPTFLVVILPLCLIVTYDLQSLDPALQPRMLLLGLFLVPLLFLTIPRARFTVALKSVPAIFLLLFMVAEIISWLSSGHSTEGLVPLLKDFSFFILFLAVATIKWDQAQIEYLGRSAIVAILLILGFTLINNIIPHWQGSIQNFPHNELTGRMAHQNLLASALMLLIPISLLAKIGMSRWLGYFAVSLALLLIYYTHSRSALLGVLAGISVFAILRLAGSRLPEVAFSKRNLGTILLLIAIPLLLVQYKVLLPKVGDGKALQSKILKTSGTDKSFTTGERLQMWAYTLAMIRDHGLLGVGPGNWKIKFPIYGSEVYRSRQGIVQFQRPHNDYLWVWAEGGIAALMLFMGFAVSVILKGLRNLRQNSSRTEHLLLPGLVAAMVVAFFSFPRERILHQTLFFILAGIISSRQKIAGASPLPKVGRQIFALGGSVLLLLTAFIAYERWRGERITRKMISARSEHNWRELISLERKTNELYFYNISPAGIPMEFYSGLAYLNQKKMRLALQEYKAAHQHHPYNLQVTNNLANTFNLLDKADSALVYYRQAIAISPYYKEGILNLASTYFNAGQNRKAYAILRQKAAEFDQDKDLYEKFVITILRAWAKDKSIVLDTLDSERLIHFHYILAYDRPKANPWPFIQKQVATQ